MANAATPEPAKGRRPERARWLRWGVLLAALGLTAGIYGFFGESLTLEGLARQEARLRALRSEQPWLVYGLAFGAYVVVTGLSLPGATGMTLLLAWFFGFWRGLVLVSFASTTGATVAFLLSRFVLRDVVQHRFGERLARFNDELEREGAFYLFTLRLIPLVPFFVINLVMGLTPIRTRTFWWVSQLGMLPGTAVYVYAGASMPDLETLSERGAAGIVSPQLVVALILLGLFPLVTRKVLTAVQRRPAADPDAKPPTTRN